MVANLSPLNITSRTTIDQGSIDNGVDGGVGPAAQPVSIPSRRTSNFYITNMDTKRFMTSIWALVCLVAAIAYTWIKEIVVAFLPTRWIAKKVAGDTVLITGAGSGLGRGLAYSLAKLGCDLVLWDIDDAANQATAKEARKYGVNVHAYKVNLCDRQEIYKMADKVKCEVDRVDILVNNAGIVTGKDYLKCPDSLIQKTMEVNIMAHFWTVKAFLPSMIERNHGHIVTISSSAGYFGVRSLADYNASKFASIGFDESLRYELDKEGTEGIHTTVVAPYIINTGMFNGVKLSSQMILPMLKVDYAVEKVVDGILRNQHIVIFPRVLYFLWVLKGIIPSKTQMVLIRSSGLMNTMADFKGREKKIH